jgi:hypothetical protein
MLLFKIKKYTWEESAVAGRKQMQSLKQKASAKVNTRRPIFER